MGLKGFFRKKSPWVLHFDTGGCNGCSIEVVAALTPRYDLERFGIQAKGTPRHADILLVSGPITKQCLPRLLNIYEQMPEPKLVVAVGACATSASPFQGCYNVVGPLDKYLPVTAYIPGCPPRPEALIDGILKVLEKVG